MSVPEMSSVKSENQPPVEDEQRVTSPAQDQSTGDGQKVTSLPQDQPSTMDGQRLTSRVATEKLHRTSPADLERSSITSADLRRSDTASAGFSHLSSSDATPGNVLSQQYTREHQVLEQLPTQVDVSPELSPTQVDFSPEQTQPVDESSSLTPKGRLVELLPEAAVSRDREDQMMNQREHDTVPELSRSSCPTDKHASGDHSPLMPGTAQAGNAHGHSVSVSIQYNTTHNNSKGALDSAHSRGHKKPSPPYVEQQSHRILDHSYRQKPREQDVRIKRPRDYIRQWRDSIDRLSAVSVTDDAGAPVSPLISHYRISLSGRSKSLDALGYSSVTRSRLEDGYPLAQRSRSSHLLSAVDGSYPHDPVHSSHTSRRQTTGERTSNDRHIPAEVNVGDIHRRRHNEVSVCAGQPEVPGVSETHPVRGNTLATSPPLTSNKDNSHLLSNMNEQTIPNMRFRSEPPASGSRALFQQHRNVQEPQTAGYQRWSFGAPVCSAPTSGAPVCSAPTSSAPVLTTPHRHHSLSPQRHSLGSHAQSTARRSAERAWRPPLRVSGPGKYRSVSPQRLWPTVGAREPADRNIHVSISTDVSPEVLAQLAEITSPQAGHDVSLRVTVTGGRSSKNQSVAPGVSPAEHSPNSYRSSDAHRTDYCVDNLVDRRDSSPPSLRRGGASRVPRREAWEQARRHRQDGGSKVDTQPEIIDGLLAEIEILRHKVDLLEGDDYRPSSPTETQLQSVRGRRSVISSEFRRDSDVILPTYRRDQGDRKPRLSEQISTPSGTGHERALSCPLLKLSRRSPATRSLSRKSVRPGTVETGTALDGHVANHGLPLHRSGRDTHLVSDPNLLNVLRQTGRQNVDLNKTTHPVKTDVYTGDLGRSFEPRNGDLGRSFEPRNGDLSRSLEPRNSDLGRSLEPRNGDLGRSFEPRHVLKWKQLISRNDLSKLEVIELKQAVACVLIENNILQTKLSSARQEVHDKLRHTDGVLEDCRQHLAQSQAENMQLRVTLKEEQRQSHAHRSSNAELEDSILQMETHNQQLQQEHHHTAMLLEDLVAETKPQIDDLKAENWRLESRLSCVEQDNFDLREEVEMLTQKQTKAVDTMDGLRKCLARTRQERQELFDELATLKDHDQRNKIREIINNFQEKGSEDEWEKEQGGAGETHKSGLSHSGDRSRVSRGLNPCSSHGRPPRKLSKSPNSHRAHDSGNKHLQRPCLKRETSPCPRGHTYYSGRYGPCQGRSSSLPGYSHPSSMNEPVIGLDIQETKHSVHTREALVDCDSQSSRRRLDHSRSPDRYKSVVPGSFTPRHEQAGSLKNSCNLSPSCAQHGLNQSRPSAGYFLAPSSQYEHHLQTTGSNRERKVARDRSTSPSYLDGDQPGVSVRNLNVYKSTPVSMSEGRNSKSVTSRWRSPATRLSPEDKDRSQLFENKRRPLYSRTEAGQMARKIQEELDQENHWILNYPHGESWVEQFRKKVPVLTKQQQQYADLLVQKYTGQIPHKQPA